jgi:hypothetical protein
MTKITKKFLKGFLLGVGFAFLVMLFIGLLVQFFDLLYTFAKTHHLNSTTMFALFYTLLCGIFFGVMKVFEKKVK